MGRSPDGLVWNFGFRFETENRSVRKLENPGGFRPLSHSIRACASDNVASGSGNVRFLSPISDGIKHAEIQQEYSATRLQRQCGSMRSRRLEGDEMACSSTSFAIFFEKWSAFPKFPMREVRSGKGRFEGAIEKNVAIK